jgi:probable rRNA maturation factor
VSVLLTDDAGIRALNRAWRGIDTATDVLSWPQEEQERPVRNGGETDPILGDVAISLETADRQARARGWDVEEEIALLLVHGMLHLLGYEDETAAGARAMRARERAILGRPLSKPAVP